MSAVAVVSNPKPRSRTRAAAELVVQRLTGPPPDRVVEVAAPDHVGTNDLRFRAQNHGVGLAAGVVAVPLMLGGGLFPHLSVGLIRDQI